MTSKWIASFCAGMFVMAAAAQDATAPKTQEATLQVLLNEVRLLRTALERNNQIAPRIQIALARMQFQEERVRSATRELNSLREQLSNFSNRRTEIASRIKNVEDQINQTTDQNLRKSYENQVAQTKTELEFLATTEQTMRAREAELSSTLNNEQAKWNEVNDLLTTFERGLAGR